MTTASPSTCSGGGGCANGMKFTTNDIDYDLKPNGNCASQYGGGWWFSWCYAQCLTCSGTNYYWAYVPAAAYHPDQTRIMMKPQ